jgi:hypothetical protein
VTVSKVKYKGRLKKYPKMTCIIGGKCKDGVILIADRKITDGETDQVEYKEKLFIFQKDSFYYPIVIGSSGTIGLYDKFKREAIEHLEKINPPPFDPKGFSPHGFDTSVSGTVYPYSSMNNSGRQVYLYPYLERLEDIIRRHKSRHSGQGFDVLFAAQVKYSGARLSYIAEDGLSEDVDRHKVIGSGEIAANVFLKCVDPNTMTMDQFGRLGFFIIKYIEEQGINNNVGVGKYQPQIYFVPNEGHLRQANDIYLEECKQTKETIEEGLRNILSQ